ncbi:MAG: hypothetical protein AAF363_14460 [Bacteroidota bacterium]
MYILQLADSQKERILQALKISKVSKKELIDALGISESAVSQFFKQKTSRPSTLNTYLEKTEELTGVNKDWLVSGVGEPMPEYGKVNLGDRIDDLNALSQNLENRYSDMTMDGNTEEDLKQLIEALINVEKKYQQIIVEIREKHEQVINALK